MSDAAQFDSFQSHKKTKLLHRIENKKIYTKMGFEPGTSDTFNSNQGHRFESH